MLCLSLWSGASYDGASGGSGGGGGEVGDVKSRCEIVMLFNVNEDDYELLLVLLWMSPKFI